MAGLAAAAEKSSEQSGCKTAEEVFQQYLRLMDKYNDYFFNGPWPKKFDYKRFTTFTAEDLNFIGENEDEYADRVLTVFLKKNVSYSGFDTKGGLSWTMQAYREQFILPELKPMWETLKELAKTNTDSEEILANLKEKFEDMSFIHFSLIELLNIEFLDAPLDLKVAEILEIIHSKENYVECQEKKCKDQREKIERKR